jgi:hypothetical protein
MRRPGAGVLLLWLSACGGDDGTSRAYSIEIQAGNHQTASAGVALAPLQVKVTHADGEPAEGVAVRWRSRTGCGSVSAAVSSSDALGLAATTPTLGLLVGNQRVEADVDGGDPVTFDFTATAAPDPAFQVLAGCNNVPERFGSDLWVADGYAYTGTWGFRSRAGNAVKIWELNASGTPTLRDSLLVSGVGTISDLEVSPDGNWLVLTAEGGGERNGLYVYELTAPGHPVFRARKSVPTGLHTGTLAVIDGTLYAFTAKDPGNCALQIYDLSAAAAGTITLASATPIPDNYCIHDTFVRDGLAFVFAWDEGLYIFDVGNGVEGGTPASPQQISKTAGLGGETHNGWWFWNPTNGEKRYLFIGEEGPGTVGVSSSGSIRVIDVSDLSAPAHVATYTLPGAGAHNFWTDEPAQVLYAAFYNGGIVALDVSGALTGDLANREIARIRPGGANNTYMWGVMLYDGYLYGSDMVSGFWQLAVP